MHVRTQVRKLLTDKIGEIGLLKGAYDSRTFDIQSEDLPIAVIWTDSETVVEDDAVFGRNCVAPVTQDLLIEIYMQCCSTGEELIDVLSSEVINKTLCREVQDELSEMGVQIFAYVNSDVSRNAEVETPFILRNFLFRFKYDLNKSL